MNDNHSIGFIGYGNMGDAIGRSLINSGKASEINVVESNDDRIEWIGKHRPDVTVVSLDQLLERSQIIFLAIKPQQFSELAPKLNGHIMSNQIIISMMAGISIAAISNLIGHDGIVRIMPNTPASLTQGVTGIYSSDVIPVDQQEYIQSLCSSFGLVVNLDDESDIHAITALSGSGPAFFYRMVDAFILFARDQNIPDSVAKNLVIQTMVGAGAMLVETPDPNQLINEVTSPNGTTYAGLQQMDSGDFDKLMYNVLDRAKARSIELSKEV